MDANTLNFDSDPNPRLFYQFKQKNYLKSVEENYKKIREPTIVFSCLWILYEILHLFPLFILSLLVWIQFGPGSRSTTPPPTLLRSTNLVGSGVDECDEVLLVAHGYRRPVGWPRDVDIFTLLGSTKHTLYIEKNITIIWKETILILQKKLFSPWLWGPIFGKHNFFYFCKNKAETCQKLTPLVENIKCFLSKLFL